MTKIIPTTDRIMFLTPTDAQEVRAVIKTLKPKKNSGYDDISSWLIKQLSDAISEPLATLIIKSMETGCMPDALKIAKIIPIFKSKETDQFKNYRPMSLLPSISKIFDKIVYKRLYHFMKSKLSSKQYGFRAKRSTIQAVTELYVDIIDSFESNNMTMATCLDLSKAFDTIDHSILLKNLAYMGLGG